ncbi:hypothetical protein ACE939_11040 [Aquimarina sp. W85]|uniref:hypothetical protein n=1 Tax=Aquimarina rhodophyticola TaxID=3342246 RepID=UPI00366CC8C2
MKLGYKIKAQAIQLALLISVLVALLLGSFLMLTHVQSFFKIKSQDTITMIRENNQRIFSTLNIPSKSDTLYSESKDTAIKQHFAYHGAWLKQYTEHSQGSKKITKALLIGSESNANAPNLYLADSFSPLVVVGFTNLSGNLYVPEQGIKPGTISGTFYQNSLVSTGKTIKSKRELPELDSHWINYLKKVTSGHPIQGAEETPLSRSVTNSFLKLPKLIFNTEDIHLTNQNLVGNIIIQSAQKIVVYPEANLKDVLLIAPIITVLDNSEGSFQSIATKHLSVGKNCNLQFPSSLVLYDKYPVTNSSKQFNRNLVTTALVVKKNTRIEGSIVYLQAVPQPPSRIYVNMEFNDKVHITGDVYCLGNIGFKGTVNGSVYTNQFVTKHLGSSYLNHILNGNIQTNPVPFYSGLPLANTYKSIAKWLY